MASKTIIIESNRNIAYADQVKTKYRSDVPVNPLDTFPNHTWTTHIPEGLPVNVGDQIQLEAGMINAVGGGDSVMEFSGQSTAVSFDAGLEPVVDNEVDLQTSYYICNRKQFTLSYPKMGGVFNRNLRSANYGEVDLTTYENFLKNYYTAGLEGFFYDGSWKVIPASDLPNSNAANPAGGQVHSQSFSTSFDIFQDNSRYFIMSDDYRGCFINTDIAPFTSRCNLRVPTGFNTPGALGEFLTAQLHQRLGNADEYRNEPVEPLTFFIQPPAQAGGNTTLAAFAQPQVSDALLKCFPTCTGKLFYKRQEGKWSCSFPGEVAAGVNNPAGGGIGYQEAQGREVFYSFLLTKKPEHIAALNPMNTLRLNGAASPAFATKGADGVPANFTGGKIFTGYNADANGVGNLGQNICIFDNLQSVNGGNFAVRTRNLIPAGTFSGDPEIDEITDVPVVDLDKDTIIPINVPMVSGAIELLRLMFDPTEFPTSSITEIDPTSANYKRGLHNILRVGRTDDANSLGNINVHYHLCTTFNGFLQENGQEGTIPNSYLKRNINTIQGELVGSPNTQYSLISHNIAATDGYPYIFYSRNQGDMYPDAVLNAGGTFKYKLSTSSMFSLVDTKGRRTNNEYPVGGDMSRGSFDVAADRDFAAVPVYMKEPFATQFGVVDVPFVGLVLANEIKGPQFFPKPHIGEFIGVSPSLNDLEAATIANAQKVNRTPQHTGNNPDTDQYPQGNDTNNNRSQSYMPYVMVGADNPTFTFSGDISRFALQGLHTQIRAGNKMYPWYQQDQGPKESAQASTEICSCFEKEAAFSYLDPTDQGKPHPFVDLQQPAGRTDFMTAQAGVAIQNLFLKTTRGTDLIANPFLPEQYQGTLLDKLGFSIEQIIPIWGRSQSQFNRSNYNQFLGYDVPPSLKYNNMVKPLTTNAYISGAVNLGMTESATGNPLETLGAIARREQTNTNTESDALNAINLPSKLDYPYLIVYSNIVENTNHYGGPTGYDKLPAIAYITRNYASGDYFYAFATTWAYTADKDYILTDIKTDIRLPDGRAAPIDPNSSIIYKITKPLVLPAVENNISTNNKKKNDKS